MHASSSARRPASTRPGRPRSSRSANRLRRYFGTDGVRGVGGEELTVDLVGRLGRAATLWSKGEKPKVFLGRDTRASGEELEEAFARGVVSAGGAAVLAGVLPTPAAALLGLGLGVGLLPPPHPPGYNRRQLLARGCPPPPAPAGGGGQWV